MRLIGPNCLGVMHPVAVSTPPSPQPIARPGNVGFHQPERRAVHGDSRLEPP